MEDTGEHVAACTFHDMVARPIITHGTGFGAVTNIFGKRYHDRSVHHSEKPLHGV